MCLLKALHWSTLVHQHIKKQQEQQKHAHTMLFSFIFFDNRKHDSATTNLHRKYIIELLKQHNIMTNTLSKIWGNAYGCAELYICVTALYLMSILSQDFYVIIDRGISAPGNGRELVYGLNSIRILFLFELISTVQLPGAKGYDTQMFMHTGTRASDVSLAS